MAEAAPSATPVASAPASDAGTQVVQPPSLVSIPGVFEQSDSAPVVPPVAARLAIDASEGAEEEQPAEETPDERMSKVEQRYKSLQGMHKTLEAKAKRGEEAEGRFMQANTSAAAWKTQAEQYASAYQQLQAEVEQLRQSKAVPSQPKAGGETESTQVIQDLAEAALSAIDEDQFDSIVAAKGERVAMAWKDQQILKHIQSYVGGQLEDIKRMVQEQNQPYQQEIANKQYMEGAKALWGEVSDYQLPGDSGLAFPELKDQKKAEAIVQLWHNQVIGGKWTEAYANSPEGILNAVSLFRQWEAWQLASHPATPQTVLDEPSIPVPAALDGSGAPRMRPAGPRSLQDSIRDNFRATKQTPLRQKLGFEA